MISERTSDLTDAQAGVFDHVVGSRGRMIRPYQLLIHAPGVALPMSELGEQIRYHSSLSDHDRELVIMATGATTGCRFEWDSHEALALAAGVRPEVLAHLDEGAPCQLTDREAMLIGFVRELDAGATVNPELFESARSALGERGAVELASTVGYYTMLAYVMGACDAC